MEIRLTNKDTLSAIHFCIEALENYKRAKNSKKIKKLESKYEKLRRDLNFKRFEHNIDLSDTINKSKKMANDIISKYSSDELISFLIHGQNLLPSFSSLNNYIEEQNKKYVLQSLIPMVIHDHRGNPVQHFKEIDEIKYANVLKQYYLDIKFGRIFLINEILLTAIKKKMLTYDSLISYLTRNSWMAYDVSTKIKHVDKEYNWLNLLTPSLQYYFLLFNSYILHGQITPNFILCIDSLTIKFEGLFRDICNFNDIETFYKTKDKKNRDIVLEKDLNAILYEPRLKDLFNEDDLLFFKFLLIEKAGMNLRNKISHTLIDFEEYSFDIMNLLFIALLKLSKFDFESKTN